MPYARRRPKTSRRRPAKRSAYGMAKSAYAISKRTQYLTKPEAKYRSIAGGSNVDSANPTTVLLNGIIQGTDVGNRIGRVIAMKSIELRLRSEINNAATATNIRYILFYDKQPNGVIATSNELLASGPTLPYDAVRNLDYVKRFEIIRDWTTGLSINGTRTVNTHKWIKIAKRPQYDASNNGDVTDIQTGALYLMLLSDESANFPGVTYTIRTRYYDA